VFLIPKFEGSEGELNGKRMDLERERERVPED